MHLFAILFSFIQIYTHDVFLQLKMINPCNQGRINHWQIGQIHGASRFNIKTLFYWFFMFLSCSPRVKNCKAFSLGLLHLIYRLRKLPTVAFIVCESASDLHELNQIAPRFMTQALNRNQCSHGRPQKYFQRGSVEISLIPFRLLTMQRKWRFTKRFTLSTH